MDQAIDQWALETGQLNGNSIAFPGADLYLKVAWITNDILGNAYRFTVVGPTQVQVSATTKTALSGVGINWGIY